MQWQLFTALVLFVALELSFARSKDIRKRDGATLAAKAGKDWVSKR